MASSEAASKPHETRFEVDGEPIETTDHRLTPVQIMELADVDPATHYLKEIRGDQQISFRDRPNEPIPVHPNERFITNSMEPGPVS